MRSYLATPMVRTRRKPLVEFGKQESDATPWYPKFSMGCGIAQIIVDSVDQDGEDVGLRGKLRG